MQGTFPLCIGTARAATLSREPYHLQMAPILNCNPVFRLSLLEAMLFYMACFAQLARERERGTETTLSSRPGRTLGIILPKVAVCHNSVTICTSTLFFWFLQKVIFAAEATDMETRACSSLTKLHRNSCMRNEFSYLLWTPPSWKQYI